MAAPCHLYRTLPPPFPLPPTGHCGPQTLQGGQHPGGTALRPPARGGVRGGAWPSPPILCALGQGTVALPGSGRSGSARRLLSSWGAGGKGQCQLPPTRASVLRQVAQHKGPRAPRAERHPVPTATFVSYNKQIHAALLLAVAGWGQLPSACIMQIYCVILERCLSLAGFFKLSFLERGGLWERGHRNPL